MLVLALSYVAMFLACGAAFVIGDASQRRAGLILLAAGMVTPWIATPTHGAQLQLFLLDAAVSAGLLVLLSRSRRIWLVALAGVQLFSTATHVGVWLGPRIGRAAYFTVLIACAYLGYAILMLGVVAHLLRARRRERVRLLAMTRELIAEIGHGRAVAEARRLCAEAASRGDRKQARALLAELRRGAPQDISE